MLLQLPKPSTVNCSRRQSATRPWMDTFGIPQFYPQIQILPCLIEPPFMENPYTEEEVQEGSRVTVSCKVQRPYDTHVDGDLQCTFNNKSINFPRTVDNRRPLPTPLSPLSPILQLLISTFSTLHFFKFLELFYLSCTVPLSAFSVSLAAHSVFS